MGYLHNELTKHAERPSTQAYIDFFKGLNTRQNVTSLASAGVAGLGLLALLRNKKPKSDDQPGNMLAMLSELANTPIIELGGAVKAKAQGVAGQSVADLLLSMYPQAAQ